MELFRLLGTIAIDSSGANSAIDETTEKAEKSEGKISKAFEKIGSAAVKVGKVMATGLAVGTAAVTALAKSALDGYANYEQLVGGVETLFGAGGQSLEEYAESVGKSVDEVKDEYESMLRAQKTVLSNAEKAFQTAGMSTNEYMETVTSFSASLIQSLSGDTETAAEKANQAIIDMSDNANKMGTAMESIQNAYQGFAKQNYTMLDNLKLGYGGTKEEMERLLSDATAISGVEYNIDSYADVVDAIHVIQEEMGITNTTAKEASATISGSASAMKASWSNLVAGFGNEDADLSGLVNQFVDSALTVVDNIVPRIGVILGGITDALAQMMPMIAEKLPELISTLLPSLIQAAITLMNGLVTALPTILQVLIEQLPFIMSQIGTALVTVFPVLLETVKMLFGQIWDYISLELLNTGVSFEDAFAKISGFFSDAWPVVLQIWDTVGQPIFDKIKDAFAYLSEHSDEISGTVSEVFEYLWGVCKDVWDTVGQPIFDTVESVLSILSENWETIMDTISTAFDVAWDVCKTTWDTVGQPIFDIIKSAIDKVKEVFEENLPKILAFFEDAMNGIKDTWENHLKPVFEAIGGFIEDTLKPAFDVAFGFISECVSTTFDTIIAAWDEVLKPAFDGICDFVTNIFSGNWSGAWESIVSTFEEVFGGIADVAKVPINFVIGYVNKAIDAINGLSFDVPDWIPGIGGETFGFNIPKIPELAEGGILEKGQIGLLEGNGAEAVVPLDQNKKWINKVAQDMNTAAGNDALLQKILDVLLEIRDSVPEEFADIIAGMKFAIGEREFARLVKAVN